jgi:hypothetical protein
MQNDKKKKKKKISRRVLQGDKSVRQIPKACTFF